MAHNLAHLARALKANPFRTNLAALMAEAEAVSTQELPGPTPPR